MEKIVTDLLKKEAEIMQRCINIYESIQKQLRIECEITVQGSSQKGKEKIIVLGFLCLLTSYGSGIIHETHKKRAT